MEDTGAWPTGVALDAFELAGVAPEGRVLICEGCGDAEAALKCEGCGDHLCYRCWGDGDDLCEACLEQPGGRPVERRPSGRDRL